MVHRLSGPGKLLRTAALGAAVVLSGALADRALAQGGTSGRIQALEAEALADAGKRSGSWAALRRIQEQLAGRFEKLVLLPQEVYEKAFLRLSEPAVAAQVVAAVQAAGRAGAGDPASAPSPSEAVLPEEVRVLLAVHETHLLARVRAEVKKEALRSGAAWAGCPAGGMHPYSVWLLTGPVAGSSEAALAGILARLGEAVATPPMTEAEEGLSEVFPPRARSAILAGYARYRLARQRPGQDAASLEAVRRALADRMLELDRPGGAAAPGLLLLAATRASLAAASARPEEVRARADLLHALALDLRVAAQGLEGRWVPGGEGGEPAARLPGGAEAASAVKDALLLDDLLGGRKLRPPPPRPEPPVAPFARLDPGDHLRRLERFFHHRIQAGRIQRDQAMGRLSEFERAPAGQRARLLADISEVVLGPDPGSPTPTSLYGRIASLEAAAERRVLLWAGVPEAPGAHALHCRIFGDPLARPADPGELARLIADLDERLLPILRSGAVEREEIDPDEPRPLAEAYAKLDQVAARIAEVDRQLQAPGLDPGSRTVLQAERQRLETESGRRSRQLESPDPLDRMEDYRRLRGWLTTGKGPDGKSVSAREREVLERERTRIERQLLPTAGEANLREAEVGTALTRASDLRGRPVEDPRVIEALRQELERLRAIMRGGPVGDPVGARPGDALPEGRSPADAAATPGLPIAPPGDTRLQAEVASRLSAWLAANGPNPWGFPPYASAAEIQALMDAAIARRSGPGSAGGLAGKGGGLEPGAGVDSGGGAGVGIPAKGKYRFWLEDRDPGMRVEIHSELEKRYSGQLSRIRDQVEGEGRAVPGSGPAGGGQGTVGRSR